MAERVKKTPAKEKKPEVMHGKPTEWADSAAIGKLIGKSARRVQQLTQEGVLETAAPPGGGARKYRTCETVQKYIAHIEAKAQETGENSRTAELNLKKLEAEVELKESQGQLHRLKTAIAEGKYISADKATEDLAEFMAAFRKFTKNIPPRAVSSLAGSADAVVVRSLKKSMGKELDTMLAAYADAAVEQPEETEP